MILKHLEAEPYTDVRLAQKGDRVAVIDRGSPLFAKTGTIKSVDEWPDGLIVATVRFGPTYNTVATNRILLVSMLGLVTVEEGW